MFVKYKFLFSVYHDQCTCIYLFKIIVNEVIIAPFVKPSLHKLHKKLLIANKITRLWMWYEWLCMKCGNKMCALECKQKLFSALMTRCSKALFVLTAAILLWSY